MEDEDFDLYGDLEEFDYKQKFTEQETIAQDLKNQLDNATKKMTMLEVENKELRKQVSDMGKSFHSLLNTARAEIKRKDGHIILLRRQKDNIIFRRTNRFQPHQLNTDPSTDAIKSEQISHTSGNDFVDKRRENYNGDSPICLAYINDTHGQKIATTRSRVHTEQNLLTTEPTCSYSVQSTATENKKELTSHDFKEKPPRTDPNHDQVVDIFNDSSLSSDSLPSEDLESCLPNVPAKHPRDSKELLNDNQNERRHKDKRDPHNLKENNDRNFKQNRDNALSSNEKDTNVRKFESKSKDSNQDPKTKTDVCQKPVNHSREEKDYHAKGLHVLKEKDIHDRNCDRDRIRNSKELSRYDRKYVWKSEGQIIENRSQNSKRRNDLDFKSDRNKRIERTDRDLDSRGLIEKDFHGRKQDRDHARNLKEKEGYDAKYSRNRSVKITQSRSKDSTAGNDHDSKEDRDRRNSRDYMKYGHEHKYDRDPIHNTNAIERRDRDRDRMEYDKYNSNKIRSTHSHRTSKQNKWTCQDAVNHQEKNDSRPVKRRQDDAKTSDNKRPKIDDSHNKADRSHDKKKTERIKETGVEAAAPKTKIESSECKKNAKSNRKKTVGTGRTRDETVHDMTALSMNYLNDVKERLQKRLNSNLDDDQITLSKVENKKEAVKKSEKDSMSSKEVKKSLFDETISDVSNDSLNFDYEMSPFEFGSETEDVPKKRIDLSEGELEDDDTCSNDFNPLKSTCKSRSKEGELIKIPSREVKPRKSETVNRIVEDNVSSKESSDRTNENYKVITVEEHTMIQDMVAVLDTESKDPEIEIDQNEMQVTKSELLQLLSDKSPQPSTPIRPSTPEGTSTAAMRHPTPARSPALVQLSTPERPPIVVKSITPTRLPTPERSPNPAWPYTPARCSTPVRPSKAERTSTSARPQIEQNQFETLIKDATKPEDKSENCSFSNELNFGQSNLLPDKGIISACHRENNFSNVSETPLVNKSKTATKKMKRAPSNRNNKLNNSSQNDLKAICLYETYLANTISSLTINGSTGILESIFSDSPKTSTKKQRKSPVYGSKKMIGHLIEGFEPIQSSEESNLETSRELKHELFKDILGPFDSTTDMINVDMDVTNCLNESQSSICCNEDKQQGDKADTENIDHPTKPNQDHSSQKSPKSAIESQSQEIDPNCSIDMFRSQESYHTIEPCEDNEEKCNSEKNVVVRSLPKNNDINLIKNDEPIYHDSSKTDDYQNPKRTIAQETDRVDLQTNLDDPQSEQINLDDQEFSRIARIETENQLNSQETGRSNNYHKTMDTFMLGNQLDSDTNPSNLANSRKSEAALLNNSQQDSIIIPECNEKSTEMSKAGELINNQSPEVHGGALKCVVEILDIKILPEGLGFQNIERSLALEQLHDENNSASSPLEEKSENIFKLQETTRDERQKMTCTPPAIPKQSKSGSQRKNVKLKSSKRNSSKNCIIHEPVNKILREDYSKPSETEYQIEAVINQSSSKSPEHEEIKLKESPDRPVGDILKAAMQIAQISDQLNVSNGSFQETSVVQVSPNDKTEPEPEEGAPSRVSPDTTIESNSSLNNSNTEKRNISIASSDYVIETVSQNIVNVFITRKKIKKKRK